MATATRPPEPVELGAPRRLIRTTEPTPEKPRPEPGKAARRQREILDFIREHLASEGCPPTVREIAERFGIGSPNGVNCTLKALERKGLLRHARPKGSRCWVPVVDEGCCPCCARPLEGQP